MTKKEIVKTIPDVVYSTEYATGNGTTDDTSALNSWLGSGDNLYLSEGEYKISSQLITSLTREGLKITGHPDARIVPIAAYPQSGTGAFLRIVNVTNLIIDGINIEGNGAIASPALTTFDNNMNGIHVEDCFDVTIQNCYFTEQPKSAIRIDDCDRVKLINNTALNCWNGATECYFCNDVLQMGSIFKGKGTAQGANGTTLGNLTGAFFHDCVRVRAINNNLYDFKTSPLKADGCYDTAFIGNVIDTFGKDGIKIQNSVTVTTLKRGVIANNIISKMRTWVNDGSCYAQLSNCDEGVIEGNVIEGDGGTTGNENGIYVFASESGFTSKNIIVANNTIKSMRRTGILTDKVSNVTISGNTVTDFSTGVTTDFGIHVSVIGNNIKILNNTVSNTTMPATNSSHGIYCADVHNVDIRGNTVKNIRQEGIRIRPAAGDYINVCDNVIESTNDLGLYIVLLNGTAVTAVANVKINGNTFAKNCLTTSTKAIIIYTGNTSNDLDIANLQLGNNTVSKGGASATNSILQMYNDGFGSIGIFQHYGNLLGTGVSSSVLTMSPGSVISAIDLGDLETFDPDTKATITGTPANNQFAVWTNASTVEGSGTNLVYDGTDVTLIGGMVIRTGNALTLHDSTNTWATFMNQSVNDFQIQNGNGALNLKMVGAYSFQTYTSGTYNEKVGIAVSGLVSINPSVTAASTVARGTYITGTLTAAANNDTLTALDVNPTHVPGAFTGVKQYLARFVGSTSNTNAFIQIEKTGAANTTTIGALYSGGSYYPGIWFAQATPSVTNYAFLFAGNTIINTPSGTPMDFRIGNNSALTITSVSQIQVTTAPTTASGTGNSAFIMRNLTSGELESILPVGAARLKYYDDFITVRADSTGDFAMNISGTGATVAPLTPPVAATNTHGVIRGNLGTTTTGRASIMPASFTGMLLGLGTFTFGGRLALVNLSDGTNTYTINFGISDASSVNPNNCVMFRYTHSVNSGQWQIVTRNGGVETATNTSIAPVAGTYQTFKFVVNSGATSITFYINGTAQTPITTNIPLGAGKPMFWALTGLRSAGTASLDCWDLDFMDIEYSLATPR